MKPIKKFCRFKIRRRFVFLDANSSITFSWEHHFCNIPSNPTIVQNKDGSSISTVPLLKDMRAWHLYKTNCSEETPDTMYVWPLWLMVSTKMFQHLASVNRTSRAFFSPIAYSWPDWPKLIWRKIKIGSTRQDSFRTSVFKKNYTPLFNKFNFRSRSFEYELYKRIHGVTEITRDYPYHAKYGRRNWMWWSYRNAWRVKNYYISSPTIDFIWTY